MQVLGEVGLHMRTLAETMRSGIHNIQDHPELSVGHEDVFVRHADAALYLAKDSGKNRTEFDRNYQATS